MSLLDPIERRTLRGRLILFAIYALLIVGGLTMVYPFGVMVGGSLRGAVDTREKSVVPRYLHDDDALWARFTEALMNERLQSLNVAYGLRCREFSDLRLDRENGDVSAWQSFTSATLADAPHWMYAVGFSSAPVTRATPFVLRDFRAHLRAKYGTLEALNNAIGGGLENWDSIVLGPESYLGRREPVNPDGLMAEWVAFKPTVDPNLRVWMSIEGYFRSVFLAARYGTVAAYNARWQRDYAEFADIPIPPRAPDAEELREDWEVFVREIAGLQWVALEAEGVAAFQDFLRVRYANDIARLHAAWQSPTSATPDFSRVSPPRPPTGAAARDLEAFLHGWTDDAGVLHRASLASLRLLSIEAQWREWSRVDNAPLPQRAAHEAVFRAQKSRWKTEFVTRNYRTVLDHILLHGRGVWNTLVYCFWAVLGALIVNPLAAYALSRYPLRSGYKIMLFCLCTMAFPPMVTQIPGFLMMRHFGMLNTFFALLLPGLANGYSIFLLKGFFDSQPRELYEAAALDGAGEWRVFWGIAMSLSKPILAVVGLNAFTLAYSNFMYAFVVCQDERMWTLMVWLYQLQQTSGQAVMYASLVVAALPTLCVFLFCQRLILRGIVVPVEK